MAWRPSVARWTQGACQPALQQCLDLGIRCGRVPLAQGDASQSDADSHGFECLPGANLAGRAAGTFEVVAAECVHRSQAIRSRVRGPRPQGDSAPAQPCTEPLSSRRTARPPGFARYLADDRALRPGIVRWPWVARLSAVGLRSRAVSCSKSACTRAVSSSVVRVEKLS